MYLEQWFPSSGDVPDIWFPYVQAKDCKYFVCTEAVFVDECTQRYKDLLETCLGHTIVAEAIKPLWKVGLKKLAQCSTKGKVTTEDVLLEDDDNESKNVIDNNGFGKTTKELIIMMMPKIDQMDDRIRKMDDRIGKMDEKIGEMDGKLDILDKEMERLHEGVSLVAERACWANLTLFVEQMFPNCHVRQPISRLKLPYTRKASLEVLASHCGNLKGKWVVACIPPDEAEIDLFVRATFQGVPSPRGAFTHFAVGEVTKSVLCKDASEYKHPPTGHLSLTQSSKLLYKLIQLERDICVALKCFTLHTRAVLGACLLSPSFLDHFDPQSLLEAVFMECPKGFKNLKHLHEKHHLRLMDM